MKARHAAVTIVSKNYFAFAVTLAESYCRFHPGHDFVIALVDTADGMMPSRLDCGAEVIELANFAIPDLGRFIYRYTIMELNTAVKPFVLADLLERRGYETILYLDPDIWVFRELSAVHAALADASIVLTPHIRRPYEDDAMPTDLTILQSGTYNLGFIGLRAGDTARRMLAWWASKLYRDCVVDIPKGLFVDQKWIDLVPGFFPDHHILPDPGYNVAYWNLHERPLRRVEGEWQAGGAPLAFFHFSGYVPFAPERLSKHQNRHDLRHLPDLQALTNAYGEALLANGYEESSAWPYAFATLSNGVQLPLELVRDAMQWAAHAGVSTPCPVSEADAFCRWLMSRNLMPHRPQVALLFHFLLERRGDVVQAFPRALADSRDPGFAEWARTSGVREHGIGDLLSYDDPESIGDPVADIFQRLRAGGRDDILGRFEDRWRDPQALDAFADWLRTQGARQMRFDRSHADALKRAIPAVTRILNIYFLRGDLQERFPVLGEGGFADWLRDNRYKIELECAEISLFQEFAQGSRALLEKMRFLYLHRGGRVKMPAAPATLAMLESRLRDVASTMDAAAAARLLMEELPIEPADHVADGRVLEPGDPGERPFGALGMRKAFEFSKLAREGLAVRENAFRRLNVAGYFTAPSGMGESARSLLAELAHARVKVSELALPHPQARSDRLPDRAALFGWPVAGADVSIAVANADAVSHVEAFVPGAFWARRNVGYWVWETEEMPARFRDAARRFDEIWTPSRYSADAIARTIGKPVRVLPHALDFEALDRARGERRAFRLPEKGTLFGFVFDPMSVLERKNVRGLVQAFLSAFRDDDDCYLVLKVNGRPRASFEYDSVRAQCRSDRILFVEGTLDRDGAYSFMRSLDAYVSLHRSEGFGLTCAEAMAMGLPVVATGYSGNLEFMDRDNSLLVPTRVVETDRPYGPYPVGSRWGDPDLEAAAGMMRTLKSRALRDDLGARGSAAVRERLDPAALGRAAQALLDDMGLDT